MVVSTIKILLLSIEFQSCSYSKNSDQNDIHTDSTLTIAYMISIHHNYSNNYYVFIDFIQTLQSLTTFGFMVDHLASHNNQLSINQSITAPSNPLAFVLRIFKSLQHVKAQSEKREPLHHLLPFRVLSTHVLKKVASDVEDHVFCFALYGCVAKIWKSSVYTYTNDQCAMS